MAQDVNIEDKSIPLTLREQSEEWYDKENEMNNEIKEPVLVEACVSADEANKKHGDRYGVDWVYRPEIPNECAKLEWPDISAETRERELVATLVLWHLERMGNAVSVKIPLEYAGKHFVISMGVEDSKCNYCDTTPWCKDSPVNCAGPYSQPKDGHNSDCATHNEPAYPNGECDCGARK